MGDSEGKSPAGHPRRDGLRAGSSLSGWGAKPGPWGVAKLVTSPPFPTRQAEDAQGSGVGKGPSHGPRSRVAAPPPPRRRVTLEGR